MKERWLNRLYQCSPAAICRLDQRFLSGLDRLSDQAVLCASALVALCAGTAAYGFSFGAWRSPTQALYSAAKMPLLFLAVVLASGLINFMLARLLGARLTLRQVLMTILVGMAVTGIILGAMSPVVLFLILQTPAPSSSLPDPDPALMRVYCGILHLHVLIVALAGLAGNVRMFGLLVALVGRRRVVWKTLAVWLLIIGFVGCELSWLMSPFLARPDLPIPFFNPNAFRTNFFEYLWRAAERLRG